jgi:uncharacterized membrane protein YkvA (DUF1232 family)
VTFGTIDLTWLLWLLIGLAALWVVLLVLFWLVRPRDVSARELIRVVPDVVRLIRSLISDRGAPLDVRVVLFGLRIWILSPVDLIPEFIPVLGPLDDVIVAIASMRYTRRRMGLDALRARWTGSDDGFALLVRVIGTGERVAT